MSKRRAANKGFRAEQRVAAALGAKKVGGPGRHDFEVGGKRGENKHFATRTVHVGHIRAAHQKGVNVLNASGRKGFSKGAKALAKDLGIELTHFKGHKPRKRGWWPRLKQSLGI